MAIERCAATDQAALSIKDVHAHYGSSHVLHGITLAVPARKVTAIVGRNGVGKTTLVNTIMGIVPPTGGSIFVGATDLVGLPAYGRGRLGLALVPQGRRVFRSLTVDEHLSLAKSVAGNPFTREWLFGLFPRLQERRAALARTLSGGEQSMLAIARALSTNPGILLMDEPTEGLAPLLVDAVRKIIVTMRDMGLSILLVEQNLAFALSVADRVAVMKRGAIVQVCERDDIDDVGALSNLILGKAE